MKQIQCELYYWQSGIDRLHVVYVSGRRLDMSGSCAPLNIQRVSSLRLCLDRARDQSTGWRALEHGESVEYIDIAFCAILLADFWTSSKKIAKFVTLHLVAKRGK